MKVQKRNPRILFVAPLPPPVHGSAMVSQYIKNSQLVQGVFDSDFVNLSTSRKMDEIGKGGAKKLLRFIGAYFTLLWKLLTHRYALCYLAITCHGMGFLKDAPFVLLCKLFRRKVVIHQHNKGMSKCVDKQPYKWLLPLVYKNTKVILLSWYLYPDIEKVVKKEQVVICPNGIPCSNENVDVTPSASLVPLKEGQCSTHYANEKILRLLFLSNLIPSKGVYVLLDACKILRERGLQFVCDFVGGETREINRATFEAAVKVRGLDDVVYYHGPKYGEEKEAYWQNADIFVQPTFEDCFPLTIVEAMQHGKSVVSTDEGAVPDLVKDGENGFVCERKDSLSLALALEKLITNPTLRQQMGERGYQRYKEHYTLEAFERKFVEVIKACCKRPKMTSCENFD